MGRGYGRQQRLSVPVTRIAVDGAGDGAAVQPEASSADFVPVSTVDILEESLPALQAQIATISHHAEALDCPEISLRIVARSASRDGRPASCRVEILAAPLVFQDHTVVAVAQKGSSGQVVVRVVPGQELPAATPLPTRISQPIFWMRKDDQVSEVTANSLADLVGPIDPLRLLSYIELLSVARASVMARKVRLPAAESRSAPRDLTTYLVYVIREIRKSGWISARQAQEKGLLPTSRRAFEALCTDEQTVGLTLADVDVAEARAALTWIRDLPDAWLDGYLYRLKLACRASQVTPQSEKMLASLITAYRRFHQADDALTNNRPADPRILRVP